MAVPKPFPLSRSQEPLHRAAHGPGCPRQLPAQQQLHQYRAEEHVQHPASVEVGKIVELENEIQEPKMQLGRLMGFKSASLLFGPSDCSHMHDLIMGLGSIYRTKWSFT